LLIVFIHDNESKNKQYIGCCEPSQADRTDVSPPPPDPCIHHEHRAVVVPIGLGKAMSSTEQGRRRQITNDAGFVSGMAAHASSFSFGPDRHNLSSTRMRWSSVDPAAVVVRGACWGTCFSLHLSGVLLTLTGLAAGQRGRCALRNACCDTESPAAVEKR
jgi:hypothetical protein